MYGDVIERKDVEQELSLHLGRLNRKRGVQDLLGSSLSRSRNLLAR